MFIATLSALPLAEADFPDFFAVIENTDRIFLVVLFLLAVLIKISAVAYTGKTFRWLQEQGDT